MSHERCPGESGRVAAFGLRRVRLRQARTHRSGWHIERRRQCSGILCRRPCQSWLWRTGCTAALAVCAGCPVPRGTGLCRASFAACAVIVRAPPMTLASQRAHIDATGFVTVGDVALDDLATLFLEC